MFTAIAAIITVIIFAAVSAIVRENKLRSKYSAAAAAHNHRQWETKRNMAVTMHNAGVNEWNNNYGQTSKYGAGFTF